MRTVLRSLIAVSASAAFAASPFSVWAKGGGGHSGTRPSRFAHPQLSGRLGRACKGSPASRPISLRCA